MDRPLARWKTTGTSVSANLLGALLTYFYFRFVDYSAAELPGKVSWMAIVFSVLAFGFLVAIAISWSWRWSVEVPVYTFG